MKKTKIIYWVFTAIFAAFMMSTAVPDILVSEDAKKVMGELGYPGYFTPFIGVAKALGSIAILIPNFKRIKEWAYAGLFFDLIGATYSQLMTYGFVPFMFVFMIAAFAVGIVSYSYAHRLRTLHVQ